MNSAQIHDLVPLAGINSLHKKQGATINQIVNQVRKNEKQAIAQVCKAAHLFKGKTETETARNIWNFLHNDVPYKADGFKEQIIKLPAALIRQGGDCKSYALFTTAVLNCLGIPSYYRLVRYNPAAMNAAHIYVVTKSGLIIDAVYDHFNAEKPYFKKNDYNTMTRLRSVGAIEPSSVNGLFDKVLDKTIKPYIKRVEKILSGKGLPEKTVLAIRDMAVNGVPGVRQQSKAFFRSVRFAILFAFKNNLNNMATNFAYNMDNEARQKVYKLFYALGGNYQTRLWPIVNAAKKQPATRITTPTAYIQQLQKQGKKLNDYKDVWKYSAVGLLPPTETAGTTAGAGLIATILAWIAANPDLTKEIITTAQGGSNGGGGNGGGGNGGGGNGGGGNGGGDNGQQLPILPLGIAAAILLS